MKDGFIKAAAGTPDVRVADCEFNATEIIRMVHEMEEQGAKVMVFPELCITAYTCGDLFWQENLLEEAKVAVVPSEGFGIQNYVRWSYATSMENIQKGLDRLEAFLR